MTTPAVAVPLPATKRITSIDLLRGIVMIIMALDHTRDMYHLPAMEADPLTPQTTTVFIFFTRWITHFCAPTFVFLSGLSAFLSSQKKSSKEASLFLLKRGLWLIMVEMVIVSFAITFDYQYHFIIWQVIWAIGCSMIILALVRLLPRPWILAIGCLLVFGHDILNYYRPPQGGPNTDIVTVLFTASGNILAIGADRAIGVFYAVLPWTGVMLIGYGIGHWFTPGYDAARRKKNLLTGGLFLVLLFITLRFINKYGDPSPRENLHNWRSILSFLNASKYPPSLMYCCMTLGPGLVFLSFSENINSWWSRIATVYGRVPFFYYILHFYILHTLLLLIFYATGHNNQQISETFIAFRPRDFGYHLWGVYMVWLSVVASLYFPCRWFYKYKLAHQQWWLKYI
jgi:uncharacterized membrane protein